MADSVADAVTAAAAKAATDAPAGWHELAGGWFKLMVANFIAGITLPSVVLALMIGMLLYFFGRLQARPTFDFARMLRDDPPVPIADGKESSSKLGTVVSLAFSSWGLMYYAISQPEFGVTVFGIYSVTWSAAQVFVEAAKRWDGSLPWAKRPQ